MISVIICSVDKNLMHQVSENVSKTIGVDFELVVFDNAVKNWGLAKVYNYAARKSKYDFLCFMHEDVVFNTNDWGKIVLNVLTNNDVGVLGVAGGIYLSKYNSGWHLNTHASRINHLQANLKTKEPFLKYYNPGREALAEVVAVDGFLLYTPRKVWEEFPFDEEKFTGFHAYDIDYSLQIQTKYKAFITYDLLVTHSSEGNYNTSWIESSFVFLDKWKNRLPVYTGSLNKLERKKLDYLACKIFTYRLMENHYNPLATVKYLYHCFYINPLNRTNFKILFYLLISFSFIASAKNRIKKLLFK